MEPHFKGFKVFLQRKGKWKALEDLAKGNGLISIKV